MVTSKYYNCFTKKLLSLELQCSPALNIIVYVHSENIAFSEQTLHAWATTFNFAIVFEQFWFQYLSSLSQEQADFNWKTFKNFECCSFRLNQRLDFIYRWVFMRNNLLNWHRFHRWLENSLNFFHLFPSLIKFIRFS